MRKRNVKKSIWISLEEDNLLKEKSIKAGITESDFFRRIINDYQVKEKPPKELYLLISQIRGIADNINQIATKLNSIGFIDVNIYKNKVSELDELVDKIKEEYMNRKT